MELKGPGMNDAMRRRIRFFTERCCPDCPAGGKGPARHKVPHRRFKVKKGKKIDHGFQE